MITKERLTELADKNTICKVSHEERVALAAELLELRQQLDGPASAHGDDWIEWAGGDCPVDSNSFVEVKLRSGSGYQGWVAKTFDWRHLGMPLDIVAYRVVS